MRTAYTCGEHFIFQATLSLYMTSSRYLINNYATNNAITNNIIALTVSDTCFIESPYAVFREILIAKPRRLGSVANVNDTGL